MVLQLESGSATAETRLVNAFHADDDDHRNEILNSLAISAANGSPYALELLLGFMTDYRLAAPAIGRHVQSPAVIEEVEQEVLIAVARSIHRFRAEAKFTTWLYSLARNTAVSELRRLKQTSSIDDEVDDWTQRRISSLVAERDMVREAVYSLPPVFRDTVLLRDVERLSYSEIAERQGLAINTVRSRLSRGRALLAALIPEQQQYS
jgi:RNA polymerase sigma-70 factor (ECF subfamily)